MTVENFEEAQERFEQAEKALFEIRERLKSLEKEIELSQLHLVASQSVMKEQGYLIDKLKLALSRSSETRIAANIESQMVISLNHQQHAANVELCFSLGWYVVYENVVFDPSDHQMLYIARFERPVKVESAK
jgi:hypothetical protein